MVLTVTQLNELVGVVGLGGVVTAVVTEIVKKGGFKAGVLKKDGDAVFHWLTIGVTVAVTAAGYLVAYHSHIPKKILGVSGAGIFGIANVVYKNSTYVKSFLSKVNISFDNTVNAANSEPQATPEATGQTSFS